MTYEQFMLQDFRLVSHVSHKDGHITTYKSFADPNLLIVDHVSYKDDEPCSKTRRHYIVYGTY